MDLMPDEKILVESDTKELVLTTHRVRYETKQWGKAKIIGIMLEELCSCEIAHTSHPGLFISAALAVIGGIASQQYYGVLIGLAVALIFVLAYLLTRKAVISLASANAVIKLPTIGMSLDSIIRFMGEIETAKNQRYMLLASQ